MQGSEDRFLNGRIVARQPLDGFRSGIDAVLLAAAVPARDDEELLELGAGAGIASLCVATRIPRCRILGVEILPALVDLSRANARANRIESRLHFEQADALDVPVSLRRSFAHVFCNPPFHHDEGEFSPNEERALALQDAGRLGDWLSAGLRRVRAGGTLSAIVRADRLSETLGALPPRGITIYPLWPSARTAAKRVIVQVRQNSRAPLALLGGLVLHEEDGRYTEDAEAILRDAGSLALVNPRL